jgi:hypothetical protein
MKLSPVLENLFETQSWSRLIASNLLFWKKITRVFMDGNRGSKSGFMRINP